MIPGNSLVFLGEREPIPGFSLGASTLRKAMTDDPSAPSRRLSRLRLATEPDETPPSWGRDFRRQSVCHPDWS